jgi:hypothetical protein
MGGGGQEPCKDGEREEAPIDPIVRSTPPLLRCPRPARALDSHWEGYGERTSRRHRRLWTHSGLGKEDERAENGIGTKAFQNKVE